MVLFALSALPTLLHSLLILSSSWAHTLNRHLHLFSEATVQMAPTAMICKIFQGTLLLSIKISLRNSLYVFSFSFLNSLNFNNLFRWSKPSQTTHTSTWDPAISPSPPTLTSPLLLTSSGKPPPLDPLRMAPSLSPCLMAIHSKLPWQILSFGTPYVFPSSYSCLCSRVASAGPVSCFVFYILFSLFLNIMFFIVNFSKAKSWRGTRGIGDGSPPATTLVRLFSRFCGRLFLHYPWRRSIFWYGHPLPHISRLVYFFYIFLLSY